MSAILKPSKTLIPIMDWAKALFPTKTPHVNTLRNWVNGGFISPRPQKIGRGWFVTPDAEYKARK
jgi:hypothetical protein